MRNEFPADLVPGMDKKNINKESLYEWIKDNYGLVPAVADEEVYAREATEEEMKVLGMNSTIVLVIKRVSYLSDNRPFEVSKIIASASEYRYRSRQINSTIKTL